MNLNDALFDAICEGDRKTVEKLVRQVVDAGGDVGALLRDDMIPAMKEVGERFSANEIFVPEMLVAARAMQAGINIIEPILAKSGHEPVARVCIGSVKGDLHDIGKNLVVMMLKGAGFAVEDLGVDVPVDRFEQAVQRGAQVVCLSALLTTTKDAMRPVVNHFKGRDVKVVIGGAVITQEYADAIGADGFGADAPDAVRAVRRVLGLPVEDAHAHDAA
ncbi:MAG: B12-binding domain-containing protein [Gammaproteobacteria bacterium]|nr:B12-binding domain-containing protein [Gammaproteobacteria bacterium]